MVIPKVVTIIQARIGSRRFPRKVLRSLGSVPLIDHVVERARLLGFPIVIAIPDNDYLLQGYCEGKGWTVFRGSEDDVLDRFYWAAVAHNADVIVRVTADCPFVHIFEMFSFADLEDAWGNAVDPYDREHVTPYMEKKCKRSVDTEEDLARLEKFCDKS